MLTEWTPEWKEERLLELRDAWDKCDRCGLCETRHRVVVGSGNADADILFIGEAPGEKEDLQGEPFVGDSGDLFTSLLEAVGLQRGDVFITNILGCRPPDNRNPTKDEKNACMVRVLDIIYLVDPLVVVPVGKVALNVLVGGRVWGIEKFHGELFSSPSPEFRVTGETNGLHIPGKVFPRKDENKHLHTLEYDVVPLLHPAFILRTDNYDSESGEFEAGGNAQKTFHDLQYVVSRVNQLKKAYEPTAHRLGEFL